MTEQPRDDAGQFAHAETLTGRVAELEAAGYKEMPEAPQDAQRTYGEGEDELRAAANELAAGRIAEEPDKVEYREQGGAGDLIDEKEAVTVERAARDLSAYHDNTGRYVDGMASDALADIVDAARAETLKADPKTAETYGLDPADVAAKAKAVEDRANADANDAKTTEEQPTEAPPIEGLDPEVQKALKHPQVRQAIEEELGKADVARQQYSNGLNVANQFAQASLVDQIPELGQIPVDQWDAALGLLYQSDPGRVSRAFGVIERVNHLSQAQSAWNQQQAAAQHAQFQQWAKAEDSRFDELTKGQPVTKQVSDALVSYAGELGIDQGTLVNLMQTQPIMRHAAFQKMMVDAARYRMLKDATPKAAPKHAPPVQRPGAKQIRGPAGSENFGALNAKLSASGNIDDALALLGAQRAARR